MASGREVHLADLPPELSRDVIETAERSESDWKELLQRWARNELVQGKQHILDQATPAARGTPPPTMAFVPRAPASFQRKCMEPPRPLQ